MAYFSHFDSQCSDLSRSSVMIHDPECYCPSPSPRPYEWHRREKPPVAPGVPFPYKKPT